MSIFGIGFWTGLGKTPTRSTTPSTTKGSPPPHHPIPLASMVASLELFLESCFSILYGEMAM